MHNVGLVAVVDAGEDLFHEDGAVTLAEFAALEDFVEELATFADLSDEVVALLVLEELVHFDNVWVILQYIKKRQKTWLELICILVEILIEKRRYNNAQIKTALTISLRILISLKSMRFSSSSM